MPGMEVQSAALIGPALPERRLLPNRTSARLKATDIGHKAAFGPILYYWLVLLRRVYGVCTYGRRNCSSMHQLSTYLHPNKPYEQELELAAPNPASGRSKEARLASKACHIDTS